MRELAILVACRETNYSLEWSAHEGAAVKAGVDRQTIDAVRKNLPLTGVDERDAAVIRFGRQLFHDNKMDSATFAKAVQLFGRKGAMDLVAVMSTYAVSGFYATAVDEHMPSGRPDRERAARRATCLGSLPGFLRSTLHFGLAAKDGAPVLVLGHRHSAFDADAHTRLRWLVLPQQSFQK